MNDKGDINLKLYDKDSKMDDAFYQLEMLHHKMWIKILIMQERMPLNKEKTEKFLLHIIIKLKLSELGEVNLMNQKEKEKLIQ